MDRILFLSHCGYSSGSCSFCALIGRLISPLASGFGAKVGASLQGDWLQFLVDVPLPLLVLVSVVDRIPLLFRFSYRSGSCSFSALIGRLTPPLASGLEWRLGGATSFEDLSSGFTMMHLPAPVRFWFPLWMRSYLSLPAAVSVTVGGKVRSLLSNRFRSKVREGLLHGRPSSWMSICCSYQNWPPLWIAPVTAPVLLSLLDGRLVPSPSNS